MDVGRTNLSYLTIHERIQNAAVDLCNRLHLPADGFDQQAFSCVQCVLYKMSRGAFQEIMHHYLRTERRDAGQVVVESFAAMMQGRVSPVTINDVLAAGHLAKEHRGLNSRDLLHLAVMHRLGVTRVITADTDFDRVPGIIRVDPADDREL